ncbi:hypothetical protein [uncultured Aquimarina sp.]|nr:hypothetical protein [uncultured Aquimarina sp.]
MKKKSIKTLKLEKNTIAILENKASIKGGSISLASRRAICGARSSLC